MQISVYIATSLDGFISRKNGDIDWLMNAYDEKDEEDYGYEEFMKEVTCLVMGRNTYEKIISFSQWPYNTKRVIVLSHTNSIVPDFIKGNVEFFNGTAKVLVKKLQQENEKKVYVDGGITIQSFIKEGLVDDFTITTIPVVIGEGRPLFSILKKDLKLELIQSKSYNNHFVQSKYKCIR